MPTKMLFDRQFDARPDRIDLRDLPYRATLASLPDKYPSDALINTYFPLYSKADLVLDQGREGACTGFGLAAVVNYLRWVRAVGEAEANRTTPTNPKRISATMLYLNARLYDEWKGEDYQGSSCRGAMKGFHKHGVCTEDFWPNFEADGKTLGKARMKWEGNAPLSPLGAYYRIDGKSLVDMQAAIHEIGAVYVSAAVHDGWHGVQRDCRTLDEAAIQAQTSTKTGGHAFALVGYTADGFIVQNSWGPSWGYHGFALLPYEDWVRNGNDAWALALGAPMRVSLTAVPAAGKSGGLSERAFRSPGGRTDMSLDERVRAQGFLRARAVADKSNAPPWIDGEEMYRSIFIGHNGKAERELVAVNSGDEAVQLVVKKALDDAAQAGFRHIAIYDHGGLNSRDDGVKRAQILGPWFEANGIIPIFVVWQSGFLESATDILKIGLEKLGVPEVVMKGWLIDKINEMKDRAFEVFARDAGVKAIWENMKFRAGGASGTGGGLTTAAKTLAQLVPANPPKIHLLGHSAGAIMQGHFLSAMKASKLAAETVHLWAPACTVSFATEHYGKAFANGTANVKKTFVGVLSDANELSDPCVPVLYSKSLLYLVSRALEQDHKTTILGLEKIWSLATAGDDVFAAGYKDELEAWYAASKGIALDPPIKKTEVSIRREQNKNETIDANHGSFDNNIEVVNQAIERILGTKPSVPVTDLRGF
jgi:hypothetical protein